MQSETCPTLGLICRSTFADLRIPQEKVFLPLEVYMTEAITISTPAKLLPLAYCIDLLKRAEQTLKLLKTHPSDATLIGLPSVQVEGLELVMARVARKQKDWIEQDLVTAAEAEASSTRSALARLHPIVKKARCDTLSAEELLSALNAEPNPKVAREQFLSQRGESVTLRDAKSILAPMASTPLPKIYRASKAYVFTVRVTSIDITSSTACFLLIDERLPEPLFSPTDSGFRAVSAQGIHTADLQLLNLCMAYTIEVPLELAISVSIGGAGLSYSGAVIRVIKPPDVFSSIKLAMRRDHSDLFSS
jgi:hypothetical protein